MGSVLDRFTEIASQWGFSSLFQASPQRREHGDVAFPPEDPADLPSDDPKSQSIVVEQATPVEDVLDDKIAEKIASPDGNYLQASPYTEQEHLLDLRTLSQPCRLFAQALTVMRPLNTDYAVEPYHEAYNWEEVRESLQTLSHREGENYRYPRTEFYIIVFRSKLPFDADRVRLGKLDSDAHVEAVQAGNLLKYWFGTPHPATGRNLATCIWRNREDAKIGGAGPGHARAMEAVRGIYLEWRVERLKLVIEEDAASWGIEKWVD